MTNRKTLSTLVFVLLLSPCLLNSMGKKYVAEKVVNFATTTFTTAIQLNAQNKSFTDWDINNTDIISKTALGTSACLLARITFRKLLKKDCTTANNNLTSLAKDFLSLAFSTWCSNAIRKKYYTPTDLEYHVVTHSLLIAGITTCVELGIDLIGYCYSSH